MNIQNVQYKKEIQGTWSLKPSWGHFTIVDPPLCLKFENTNAQGNMAHPKIEHFQLKKTKRSNSIIMTDLTDRQYYTAIQNLPTKNIFWKNRNLMIKIAIRKKGTSIFIWNLKKKSWYSFFLFFGMPLGQWRTKDIQKKRKKK